MLVEKIIYVVIALYLLILMFFKLIKKIDKIYIPIIVIQLISLVLGIIEIIFPINYNIILKIIMYTVGIIIPIIIILLEKKGKNFAELFLTLIAKIYETIRKQQEKQRNMVTYSR